ncbi:Internalin-J [Capnocytophaga canimorsus Cc5]|uniref:Internalin-J n=1 Tax=Capnocytophaga canimorsus (strain 5) TaxID=860228 RepID=F9YQN5_CAPCC|nr:Ig-like domain-containing protein [Capnocytophaga canimorsus]AEK23574.1 Internalin-J [Capnocytophaga canimorsus Cc5]
MRKTNFRSMLAIGMIAVAPLMSSCNKSDESTPVVEITEVQISKPDFTMLIGETTTLVPTITPENATDKKLTWVSSAPNVAEVDVNGKIFAKSRGRAEITATTTNGKTATCKVIVLNARINSVEAEDGYMILETGKSVGEQIALYIKADPKYRYGIWIDLNNDGEKQHSETNITFDQEKNYTLGARTITIYGKITTLNCSNGKLYNLSVENNKALEELNCLNNSLTILDVSQNTALQNLWCQMNFLTIIDVSQNKALKKLECYYNRLTTLDISQNKSLGWLSFDNNQIKKAAMNAVLGALPERSTSDEAKVYIQMKDSAEEGNELPDAAKVIEAKMKNWKVYQFENGKDKEL